MSVQQNSALDRMAQLTQSEWDQLIASLANEIHPVDREATQIWFAFWPLKLARGLKTEDVDALIRDWRLRGRFRLGEVLDESVHFLYGSRYFGTAREAVLAVEQSDESDSAEAQIRSTAARVAHECGADPSLTLGIAAIAWMARLQVSQEIFGAPPTRLKKDERSPQQILKVRNRPHTRSMLRKLFSSGEDYRVRFDESRLRDGFYRARPGQDLSMASASDRRDYFSTDDRKTEGPVPYECRSGSCGFCWVGILGGGDHLEPLSEFELKRLQYFGYVGEEVTLKEAPPIRLACQSQCNGPVSLVVSFWNGMLDGRG